jgi:Trk-type K+ transport system membrane component
MLKASIKDFFANDIFIPREEAGKDTVSNNTKVVLYALFFLVGIAVLMYAITVMNPNYNKYNAITVDNQLSNILNNTALNTTEKLLQVVSLAERSEQNQQNAAQEFEQLEQINSVYIAAISGALALGGTLIAQLWGRTKKSEEA